MASTLERGDERGRRYGFLMQVLHSTETSRLTSGALQKATILK